MQVFASCETKNILSEKFKLITFIYICMVHGCTLISGGLEINGSSGSNEVLLMKADFIINIKVIIDEFELEQNHTELSNNYIRKNQPQQLQNNHTFSTVNFTIFCVQSNPRSVQKCQ